MLSNNFRRIVFTILAVTWMVVIFSFSERQGDESEEQSIKAGMMVCHVFVPGFDDLSKQQQIHMAQAIDHPVRKTAHATEYAMLAGLVLGAVTVSIIRWKNVLVSVCIAVLYASTDELHQLFVPGRSGRVAANSGDRATIQAGGQAASSRREGVVNSGSYQRGQGQSGK